MNETPYLRRRGERWFFILGDKRAREAGWFHDAGKHSGRPKGSIPLGVAAKKQDISRIRKTAHALYEQYLEDSGKSPLPPADAKLIDGYPPDSLGAFYFYWRRKGVEWSVKSTRTREDYSRSWKHIGPALGALPLGNIAPDRFANFHRDMEAKLSPWERFRVIKCARAILNAAVKRKLIEQSPATLLPNPMPAGRAQYFVAAEIFKLAATAWQRKKRGLALAIWTAWETALAPPDIRTLNLSMLRKDRHGAYISRERTKTSVDMHAALSGDLLRAIEAYLAEFETAGIVIGPHAPIFRKRHGTHYKDRHDFAQDFARVRTLAMKGDKRQFQDIRRSANLEMRLGDASPKDRAELLANTLHKSKFLDQTYTPPTVALSRQMAAKRVVGRAALAPDQDAAAEAI